jgi:hypothetical protein
MGKATPLQIIDAFLRGRLKHTGSSGFEGLVAVLIQEATRQEFRLSSSGRQAGRDAASESGYEASIKVETKHYGKSTSLKPRELVAEIQEAANSDANLDIWVLAASREVSGQIADSLDQTAASRGVEVAILDIGINGLPRVAVLMASFPSVVRAWASRHRVRCDADALEGALLALANEPDFDSAKARLLAKLNSLTGYNGARRLVHERLLKTLRDPNNARAVFHQPLGIRAPGVQVVRRSQLCQALDSWWDVSGVPQPVVVLGEEGTGKTWAVFDWVAERVERGEMPIVLPLGNCQLANGDSVESLLPRLIAKWTGVIDENRWRRRLHRWLRAGPAGRPLVLVLMDGLNERAELQWPPLLADLLGDPWRTGIAMLATDRPHHWRTRCSRAGLSTFDVIEVAGYSPQELDQALAASGLSHKDIPNGLLPLASTPRYCALVASHHKEMVASGDFTRERLIYIDVVDRRSKLGYPLTEHELLRIIRDLAEHARQNPELDPKDLRPLLAVPGGDEANIYEEIAGGGLLVPAATIGGVEAFRVEPLRLIYGFGMLLAAELSKRPGASTSELEEFLASWFEPGADMDRKVEICGSAMFHALFRNDFPETCLRELIRYWLGLRNWADTAQLAFAGYVLRRPTIFLEMAEHFWSAAQDSSGAQEFLGSAFVAHRNDTRLQPAMIRAIERWMGFIHPLGPRYFTFDPGRISQMRKMVEARTGQRVIGLPDEAQGDRVRQGIEQRLGCPIAAGEVEVAGVRLTVIEDGALLRLARLGLMIISAGDVSPFIGALVNWAVAAGVMEDIDFGDLVSWVVRLATQENEAALLERARALLSRNEATASAAARILLLRIGSAASESLIQEHDLTPDWYKQRRAEHAKDPCRSLYEWTEDESFGCLARTDVPLHIILERAGLLIADPSITLPVGLAQRASDSLRGISPSVIHAAGGTTLEDHNLEVVTRILCAHSPSEIGSLHRAVVRTMPGRNLTGQYFLAIHLPELSLLFSADEVAPIIQAISCLSANGAAWSDDDTGVRQTEKVAEGRAFIAVAPHLTSSELLRRLIGRPPNAYDLVQLEPWFGPVSDDAAREAIALLHQPSNAWTLYRILWVLPHLGVSLSDLDRSRLVALAGSDDPRARAGAMRVAVVAGDEALGRAIVDLGKPASPPSDSWEESWLTRVLAHFGGHLPLEEIATRLRPAAMGYLIAKRGSVPEEIDVYASCLDREWRRTVEAADDTTIESLPEITAEDGVTGGNGADDTQEGPRLARLHSGPTGRTVRLDRSSSWTSGPPTESATELHEMFAVDPEARAKQLNEDLRRRADAILAAWRTDAYAWFGRIFSLRSIDSVYQRHPSMVERWTQPAMADSSAAAAVRTRLGGILAPTCRVLLDRNPGMGRRLWNALSDRNGSPVVFDTTDIAFSAEDNPESSIARYTVLQGCWDDESIARIAVACARHHRREWLDKTVGELISAERPWRRAKGLALASFSDLTQDRFEELVSQAAIGDTWVGRYLRPLRENVRKNRLARHWYSVFLRAKDPDASWGALQLVLALADERFLNWRSEVEQECAPGGLVEVRLRFLALGWTERELEQRVDRSKDRKERLFGIRIEKGEIFPFMSQC